MKQSIKWFIKEEWLSIAAGLSAPLLFLVVFALYRLDMRPAYYAAALYWAFWFGLVTVRFIRRLRLHRARRRLIKTFAVSESSIDRPETQTDEDYSRLLNELSRRITEITDARINERQEASAYYTMWVHQIKTPIAAMRMLLQTEDTDTSRTLQSELFRIDRYAEMALGYIRLDESGNDLVFRQVKLDDIIRGAIRKYAPQFIARRLAIHYEPTDTEVLTDEKWLSFILEQLLSNAVKYTKTGSVTISVTPDKTLIIKDTGIGIPAEDLPRIFEKGFTGTNGRTDKKATGLGLYLCRRAANMLDIGLAVESIPGHGTEFRLMLDKKAMGRD